MAFKVMGVTAGRKNSNSEILLKEALLACQEMGAEVRMNQLEGLQHSGLQWLYFLHYRNVYGKTHRMFAG